MKKPQRHSIFYYQQWHTTATVTNVSNVTNSFSAGWHNKKWQRAPPRILQGMSRCKKPVSLAQALFRLLVLHFVFGSVFSELRVRYVCYTFSYISDKISKEDKTCLKTSSLPPTSVTGQITCARESLDELSGSDSCIISRTVVRYSCTVQLPYCSCTTSYD